MVHNVNKGIYLSAVLAISAVAAPLLAHVKELRVPTTQGAIAVWDSAGTGPAVLLIHGNSASGKIFKKQFDSALGIKYRLLAVDLHGHGNSDPAKSNEVYSFPGYAKVLAEVVRKLQLPHVVLVGWSLGGHIALEMSLLLSNVKGVLITGTPPIELSPEGLQKGFKPFDGLELLGHPEAFTRQQAERFMGLGGIDTNAPEAAFIIEDAMKAKGVARKCMFTSISNGVGNDETKIVRELQQPLAIIRWWKRS